MRARAITFAICAVSACVAFGQTQGPTGQSLTQVFHFTYAQTMVDIQQITNAIRSVGEITQATLDVGSKTLTVTGTTAQLAITSWIFTALDQPAPANHATQQYRPAGTVNDVTNILYLTQPRTPQSFQEILNAVRTIPEIVNVFPNVSQNAIVMRGTDSQAAMGEWLFHQLDVPAGVQPAQNLATHQYAAPGVTNDQAEVLYLSHEWTLPSMQEIVNAVRTIPQLTKVFPCVATGAVAVRGAPATLTLATWLFNQLDQAPRVSKPASAPAPQEFQMPGGADDVTQLFYLAPGVNLQSVLGAVKPTMRLPVFQNAALNALILRGTATQIAAADLLIKQMNQP